MRSRGEGSIVRLATGGWQARLQVDGVRKAVYGKTRQEAAQKLAKLKAEAAHAGFLPNPAGRTFADLLAAWLEAGSPNWKPATLEDYTSAVERYLRPPLGDVPLAKLDAGRLARLISGYQRKGQHRTALRVYRAASQALDLGVRWGWLSHNPCDRIDPPRYQPQRKELWTPEQLRSFLQADHWLQPLWVFLVATGVRLGEALALQWDDVDFAGETVRICKSTRRIAGQHVVTTPKTKAGERVIALPAQAVDALQKQKAWQTWRGVHTQHVFCGHTSPAPLSAGTVHCAMRELCKRLGLPPLTPHGLRHLHASLLLAEGLPLPAVSQRLGHANTQVTASVYAHALRGADRRAAEALSSLL